MVNAVNASQTAIQESNTILAEIGADDDARSSDVTITDLGKILPALTSVVPANENAYRAYIADPANPFDNPARQAEVQAMVNAVNANQTSTQESDTILAEIGADDDARSSDVTIADLGKILPELTSVVPANENGYRAYIADPANPFDNQQDK